MYICILHMYIYICLFICTVCTCVQFPTTNVPQLCHLPLHVARHGKDKNSRACWRSKMPWRLGNPLNDPREMGNL